MMVTQAHPSGSQVAHGFLVLHLLFPRNPVLNPVSAASPAVEVLLAAPLLVCARDNSILIRTCGAYLPDTRAIIVN
jgi:hypothetical protein